MRARVLGLALALIAALILTVGVGATTGPAEATVRGYCNRNHSKWASTHSQHVGQVGTVGTVGTHTTYLLCHHKNGVWYYSIRYFSGCYTHTSIVPSVSIQGVVFDYWAKNNRTVTNQLADMFLQVHPPVFHGDHFCLDDHALPSKKWRRLDLIPRWHSPFRLAVDGQPDPHYDTGWVYLSPHGEDHRLS